MRGIRQDEIGRRFLQNLPRPVLAFNADGEGAYALTHIDVLGPIADVDGSRGCGRELLESSGERRRVRFLLVGILETDDGGESPVKSEPVDLVQHALAVSAGHEPETHTRLPQTLEHFGGEREELRRLLAIGLPPELVGVAPLGLGDAQKAIGLVPVRAVGLEKSLAVDFDSEVPEHGDRGVVAGGEGIEKSAVPVEKNRSDHPFHARTSLPHRDTLSPCSITRASIAAASRWASPPARGRSWRSISCLGT